MSRIFTTKFLFNHQLYDAIIVVLFRNGKMNFTIKLMDIELYDLIPEGLVKYEGTDGFKEIDAIKNSMAQSLMQSIATAIENHLVSPA